MCISVLSKLLHHPFILQVVQPAGKVSTKVEEDRKDESPASWRLGLRKTGSYGALSEITATKEAQREKDTTGVMRSASSPRLTSSLDNKEKEKVGSDELDDLFFQSSVLFLLRAENAFIPILSDT